MTYYKNQLNKLIDTDYYKTIAISDGIGNKTNYMILNLESLDDIISFLISEKRKLIMKKADEILLNKL